MSDGSLDLVDRASVFVRTNCEDLQGWRCRIGPLHDMSLPGLRVRRQGLMSNSQFAGRDAFLALDRFMLSRCSVIRRGG